MAIHASDCDAFVVILVDADAGTTYLVDNRFGEGSTGEGTPSLTTRCAKGAMICWSAQTIVPCRGDTVSIQSIGNSEAWGFSGQPQPAPDLAGAFTGQAQNAIGATAYALNVNLQLETGSFVQPIATPQISVQGPPPTLRARRARAMAIADVVAQPVQCPNTMILVALDANRFRASTGASGAYLIDNRVSIGSTNEGSPRLRTQCNAGDRVGFGVLSINPFDGYTVTIAAINMSAGPIFPSPLASRGSLWIGRAVKPGTQPYALTLRIDDGIAPFSAVLTTPSLTCR